MKRLSPVKAAKHFRFKKIFLLCMLLLSGLIAFLDVRWSYQSLESGLGATLAGVVLTYHMVLLLSMVGMGLWLGLRVEHLIRERKSIFQSPTKGSWAEVLMNLWGYELDDEVSPDSETQPEPEPASTEPFELLDLPTRRGRKPTFPLERWLPIALQWENRDPIRDAFTLGELISEHLGTNSDGSPIVSEQTYYSTWRPRAITELRNRAKSRKYGPPKAEK